MLAALHDALADRAFGVSSAGPQEKSSNEYTRGGHSLRNVFGIMTPLEWGRMQKENWHIVISA